MRYTVEWWLLVAGVATLVVVFGLTMWYALRRRKRRPRPPRESAWRSVDERWPS